MQAYFDSFRFDALQYKWNIITSDSTPEKTYEAFRQALLDNDLDIVLKLIHPDYLWKYEEGIRSTYEKEEFVDCKPHNIAAVGAKENIAGIAALSTDKYTSERSKTEKPEVWLRLYFVIKTG